MKTPGWLKVIIEDAKNKTKDRPRWRRSAEVNRALDKLNFKVQEPRVSRPGGCPQVTPVGAKTHCALAHSMTTVWVRVEPLESSRGLDEDSRET